MLALMQHLRPLIGIVCLTCYTYKPTLAASLLHWLPVKAELGPWQTHWLTHRRPLIVLTRLVITSMWSLYMPTQLLLVKKPSCVDPHQPAYWSTDPVSPQLVPIASSTCSHGQASRPSRSIHLHAMRMPIYPEARCSQACAQRQQHVWPGPGVSC